MKYAGIALLTFVALAPVGLQADEHEKELDRFLEDHLIGYLSTSNEHSCRSLEKRLEADGADRVSRFVVSGYSRRVSSLVCTIVEKSDETWIEASWMLDRLEEPRVYRTKLLAGDVAIWKEALENLDHEQLSEVDDVAGKRTLDGRSIYLAVKSKRDEFQYGFRNPSYAKLPGLQSIRVIDLLIADWIHFSSGPAIFGYPPNRGTVLLGDLIANPKVNIADSKLARNKVTELKEAILDSVEFSETPIREALKVIQARSLELMPDSKANFSGISIRYFGEEMHGVPMVPGFSSGGGSVRIGDTGPDMSVNVQAQDISLWDVMIAICRKTGLAITVDEHGDIEFSYYEGL